MQDGKVEVFFNVPASKCGLVIGKGGETIRQINSESNVYCELDRRPPANPMEKTFIIRGDPAQIDVAKRMICEKAGMDPSQVMGGGGPGGPGGPPGGNFGAPQGWGNTYPQWGQGGAPNDPSKAGADPHNAAAWAAYYQSYPGIGGQGQPPQQAQQPQPQQQPAAQPQQPGGTVDYSAQWAEYYRSMGMTREAEAIEAQAKGIKPQPAQQQPSAAPAAAPAPAPAPAAPAANGAAAAGGQDFSQQWIQYYRSQGMHAEADKIEAQLKQTKPAGAPAAAPAAAVYGGQFNPGQF